MKIEKLAMPPFDATPMSVVKGALEYFGKVMIPLLKLAVGEA